MLTIMLVIFAAAVPGTAALIFFKRAKREEDELLRVRESRAVAVLGGLLWAFALGMYLYCLLAPGRLYTTESGAVNVAVFLGMGLAFGAAALLTYFVKCTVATERGVLAVGLLGGRELLAWRNIIKLQEANGRLMLLDAKGRQCSVGGNQEQLRQFVQLAKERLRPGVGAAVLKSMEGKLAKKK